MVSYAPSLPLAPTFSPWPAARTPSVTPPSRVGRSTAADFWYRPPSAEDSTNAEQGGALTELTRELVTSALDGDDAAIRALVADLTPVIQARAGRALLRRRALARGGDVRQQLDDVVQDVFVELFRDDGKALRAWDPARGMGLRGFVGLIAEQRVAAILRSRRKNPWTEDLSVDAEGHEEPRGHDDPELDLASRQAIQQLFDLVRAELTPLGRDLFQRLILDEEPIASVCAATGMSTSAVQAWSSRLKRLVQKLAAEIVADRGSRGSEAGT